MVQQDLSAQVEISGGVDRDTIESVERLERLLERVDTAISTVEALPADVAASFEDLTRDVERLQRRLEQPESYNIDVDEAVASVQRLERTIDGINIEQAFDEEAVRQIRLDISDLGVRMQRATAEAGVLRNAIRRAGNEDVSGLERQLEQVEQQMRSNEDEADQLRRGLERVGHDGEASVRRANQALGRMENSALSARDRVRQLNRELDDLRAGGTVDVNVGGEGGGGLLGSLGDFLGIGAGTAAGGLFGRLGGRGRILAGIAAGAGAIGAGAYGILSGRRDREQEFAQEGFDAGLDARSAEALSRIARQRAPGLEQQIFDIFEELSREVPTEALLRREQIPTRAEELGLPQEVAQAALRLSELEVGSAEAAQAALDFTVALQQLGLTSTEVSGALDEFFGGTVRDEIVRLIRSQQLAPAQAAFRDFAALPQDQLALSEAERRRREQAFGTVGVGVDVLQQQFADRLADRLAGVLEGAAGIDPLELETVMRDATRDGVGEALDGRQPPAEADPFAPLTTSRR